MKWPRRVSTLLHWLTGALQQFHWLSVNLWRPSHPHQPGFHRRQLRLCPGSPHAAVPTIAFLAVSPWLQYSKSIVTAQYLMVPPRPPATADTTHIGIHLASPAPLLLLYPFQGVCASACVAQRVQQRWSATANQGSIGYRQGLEFISLRLAFGINCWDLDTPGRRDPRRQLVLRN